tara:strand:- start:51610 stop:52770 length:1161 start_codon:yes stop_codon:yes gene_type:complete
MSDNYMKLDMLLQAYPNVKLATREDNSRILEYFNQSQLNNAKDAVIYKRSDDFFSLLRARSENYLVLFIELKGKIKGMASMSYHQAYVDQKLTTVGYLGDLRISLDKKAIVIWRKFYQDFLKNSPNMKETQNCQHYYSALMNSNARSNNTLVEGKVEKVQYQLENAFTMVNVIGRYPYLPRQKEFHLKTGALSSTEMNFVEEIEGKRKFGLDWKNEYSYRLKHWQNFDESNFIKVYFEGELLAVTSFWDPSAHKTIQLNRISSSIKYVSSLLSHLPLFHFKKAPKPYSNLNIIYLNQINFKENLSSKEKEKILKNLFLYLLEHCKGSDSISYCNLDFENIENIGYPFFTEKLEMGIYSIKLNQEVDKLDKKKGQVNGPLSFDMQLV